MVLQCKIADTELDSWLFYRRISKSILVVAVYCILSNGWVVREVCQRMWHLHTVTQPNTDLCAIPLVQCGYTNVMLNNQMAYIFVKQQT